MKPYRLTKDKFLTDRELSELREELSKRDTRDKLLIEFALATGARAQEILNASLHDLNPDQISVYIHGLKSSNDREIPLRRGLFKQVYELAQKSPTGKPFDISYSRLVQIWNAWRPGSKSFHSLRHTFAVELYKQTQNIRLVQMTLGHRNIMNTMIYVDFLYSQKEIRKLMNVK
jgi:integrase